jgi:nucleoside-diphosphate-sugar epimerase
MEKSKPILVTGASGYLASWIIKYLLEDGYKVRGTVRNNKNIGHLQEFKNKFGENFEIVNADLLLESSFDEAVKDCELIMHTASPFFIGNIKNAEEQLIKPAVKGTENVLNSATKSGTVKRIVQTSSIAAVHSDSVDILNTENNIFTEKYWNTGSSAKYNPYQYSKTMAEKKGWELAEKQNKWKLTTINPGFILGPSLSNRTDSESINFVITLLNGKYKSGVPEWWFGVVDVRDVAKAHILAGLNENASGRHIVVSNSFPIIKIADFLRKDFSSYKLPKRQLPKLLFYIVGPMLGFSWKFISKTLGIPLQYDNSYSIKDLGLKYTDFEKTICDHAKQLIEMNLIK